VTTLLAAAVLVAVLACPAQMLWRKRQSKSNGLPSTSGEDDVRVRQAELARRVNRARAERG